MVFSSWIFVNYVTETFTQVYERTISRKDGELFRCEEISSLTEYRLGRVRFGEERFS